MKKILKTLFVFFIAMLFYNAVNAASVTISPTTKEIKPGESVQLTIGVVEAAGWDLKVTNSGGTLSEKDISPDTSGVETTKTLLKPTFTATKEGTYTITVSGEITYEDEKSDIGISKKKVSATSKITVKADEPPKQEEDTNQGGTTTPPENNNTSTNKPSGGDSNNNTSGNESNGNNTSSGNDTSNNTGTSGSGSGTTTEKPEQKPAEKSSNNKLKNLGIKPNDFTGFKSGTTKYNVSVPNDVEEIEVYAEAQDSKAKVSGTGKMQLQVGSNQAKVICTAEDGTTKTYVINITRKEVEKVVEEEPEVQEQEEPEKVDTKDEEEPEETTDNVPQITIGLSKLEVLGKDADGKTIEVELSPTFDENLQEYLLTVPLNVVDLEVNAEATTGEAKIEVMGNKDLVAGENIVTVIVKIGENTKVYEIKVNKVEVESSFLSQELIMQLAVIAAIITIVIVAIIAIIVMIVKNSKKDNAPRRAKARRAIEDTEIIDDNKNE